MQVRAGGSVQAPAGADKVNFTLKGLSVEGAATYKESEIRALYADKIGKEVTLAEVFGIANDITMKYRNDGYILTQVVVPPQTIEGGTVRLQVVEGFVDKINIRKENADAPINTRDIEAYAAKINAGGALNVAELERQLLLINDLPGVTARSVLSPSATTPGASDMDIILSYDPVDALLSVDNFGSRYLGPVQVGGAVTLNSMLGLNEAITFQTVMAPQSWYELAYGSIGYEQPVGTLGTKAHVRANVTDTEPGHDLEEFDVRGRSYLLNVGVSHPFIRSRTENLTGRFDYDWRRVRSSNNVEETRRDRISALRLGGRYELVETLIGPAANTVDVELSKGIGLFASDEGDENLSRAQGDPNFTKVVLEFQRLQRVTGSVNVLLAARGQKSSDALLSSEEFSIGGMQFGRGYDPSEIAGDDGIAGTVELQWKDPVAFDNGFIESYQLYGFYDVGRVWNKDATTSSQKRDSLASVGPGVRLDLPMEVQAGFAVAFPLTREVETENDKSPRYYFNLSKRF